MLVDPYQTRDAARLARYRQYLDFYDGAQWERARLPTERRITSNYARALVRKVVSYLFPEPPTFSANPDRESGRGTRRAMRIAERWRTALVLAVTAGLVLLLGFALNRPDQAGFVLLPAFWATYVAAGYLLHNRWALLVPVLAVALMTIPGYLGSARRFPEVDQLLLLRGVIRGTLTTDCVIAAGLVALGAGLYRLAARQRSPRRSAVGRD